MSLRTLFDVRLRADPAELKGLREMVREAAVQAGCDGAMVSELVLAINEACMNVIQHAYGGEPNQEMAVTMSTEGSILVCRIEDNAPPANLDAIKPRALDELRPGGLGTHFMAELMDDCQYGHLRNQAGNFLEMRKKIT